MVSNIAVIYYPLSRLKTGQCMSPEDRLKLAILPRAHPGSVHDFMRARRRSMCLQGRISPLVLLGARHAMQLACGFMPVAALIPACSIR